MPSTWIVRTFIAAYATGDTSCAADVNTPFHTLLEPPSSFIPYHGVGRFPVHADDAVPARVDPTGINRGDKQDRQVASVAWSTVLDAIMRAQRMTGTSGRQAQNGDQPAAAATGVSGVGDAGTGVRPRHEAVETA